MLIGYARVSTADQNLDFQKVELEKAGCERIFVDKISGITAVKVRPGLLEALEHLREGDTLVVWKTDRLGRSLRELIDTVDEIQKKGMNFKSLTEPFDTTTPAGVLFFQIVGAFAEMERQSIRERTRAGLSQARRLGRLTGRPKKMTRRNMEAGKAMICKGVSYGEVAKELGVSRQTIYRHFPWNEYRQFFEEPTQERENYKTE